jgi:hypothetical protein
MSKASVVLRFLPTPQPARNLSPYLLNALHEIMTHELQRKVIERTILSRCLGLTHGGETHGRIPTLERLMLRVLR